MILGLRIFPWISMDFHVGFPLDFHGFPIGFPIGFILQNRCRQRELPPFFVPASARHACIRGRRHTCLHRNNQGVSCCASSFSASHSFREVCRCDHLQRSRLSPPILHCPLRYCICRLGSSPHFSSPASWFHQSMRGGNTNDTVFGMRRCSR